MISFKVTTLIRFGWVLDIQFVCSFSLVTNNTVVEKDLCVKGLVPGAAVFGDVLEDDLTVRP